MADQGRAALVRSWLRRNVARLKREHMEKGRCWCEPRRGHNHHDRFIWKRDCPKCRFG